MDANLQGDHRRPLLSAEAGVNRYFVGPDTRRKAAHMANVLVQVVSGPENATRAALGLLVAKSALDEGHDVTLFLAADGVHWVNRSVTDAVAGLGGGKLSDTIDALKGNAKIYASKLSLGVRGISEDAAATLGAEMGTPQRLVQLALESDTTLTY